MSPSTAGPRRTVTFLFTDIEGSTRHVSEIGPECWHDVLEDHAQIMRAAISAAGGAEMRTAGDAAFTAFDDPASAIAACVTAQRALSTHDWPHGCEIRVRMGLHTGEALRASPSSGADFVGVEIHRAARVAAVAHGGQVLLSAATAKLVEPSQTGVAVRYLGEFRLRDLSRPERIYQLVIDGLPSDFPPLHSLDRVPNQLPVQVTTFIGRDREIAAALRLLLRSRVLTLVGPAGTGKTRLALQLAAEAAEQFPEGVFFADLTAIGDPELLATVIARTLRVELSGPRPPLEQVIDRAREKRLLLVLDNFEHILPAATQVATLVSEAESVTVLVTSRAPLLIQPEQQFGVPPMSLPTAAGDRRSLEASEAVRLFTERAVAVRPDLVLTDATLGTIGRICARLEGLPLAIELAAARARVLPPAAILERLDHRLAFLSSGPDDMPERHRTLRGTIAWSYELLDERARRLLDRLGVFVGGGELDEIDAVCGPEVGGDVLEAVSALVDHSLVRAATESDQPRFVMLETIREYALERLAAVGAVEELRARHARTYLDLAERLAGRLFGPDHKATLDRFERDHENFAAAVDGAVGLGDAEAAARLAVACWRYWQIRGHLREARTLTDRVLTVVDAHRDRALRIRALEAAGGIAYWQGDMEATRARYHEQVELVRADADRKILASALFNEVCANFDRPGAAAVALADECVAAWREIGDPSGMARSLWAAGIVRWGVGEFDDAQRLLLEAIARSREVSDQFQLGWALHMFGINELSRTGRDLAAAHEGLAEGLRIFAAAHDVTGVGLFLFDLSAIALAEGDRDRAVRLAAASEAVTDRAGTRLTSMLVGVESVTPATLRDGERAAWDEARAWPMESAIAYALGDIDPQGSR